MDELRNRASTESYSGLASPFWKVREATQSFSAFLQYHGRKLWWWSPWAWSRIFCPTKIWPRRLFITGQLWASALTSHSWRACGLSLEQYENSMYRPHDEVWTLSACLLSRRGLVDIERTTALNLLLAQCPLQAIPSPTLLFFDQMECFCYTVCFQEVIQRMGPQLSWRRLEWRAGVLR